SCQSRGSRSSPRSLRGSCSGANGSSRSRCTIALAPTRRARSSPPSTASACCGRCCGAASPRREMNAVTQRTGPSLQLSLARLREAPFASALLACVALALISGAVLPTVPSYDPWSWIVWGREVFDPHLSLLIGGGSSWKPFPVLFTAWYGLFSAAPWLWVVTE